MSGIRRLKFLPTKSHRETVRLYKNLIQLRKRIPGRLVRNVLEDAGEVIRQAIEERAPVRTGTLKRNIIRKTIQKFDQTSVLIGPAAKVWYAHFPERGTIYAAANPYIRPGFKATKQIAARIIERGLWRNIKRTVK